MRQLSKMEQQTGIFTMRCTLSIESNMVSIVDGQSGVSNFCKKKFETCLMNVMDRY